MVRSRVSRKVCAQIAGGALALVIGLGFAGGALAANEVRTTVVGGNLTASIKNLNLGNVAYSHAPAIKTGTMVLTVDDKSGTGAGWHVTVLAGDFEYDETVLGGPDIPAANFSLTSAAEPLMVEGQAVVSGSGPMVPSTVPTGGLNVSREVVESNAGFGMGKYTQDLGVSLTVPGDSFKGVYTSTLTVTAVAAP